MAPHDGGEHLSPQVRSVALNFIRIRVRVHPIWGFRVLGFRQFWGFYIRVSIILKLTHPHHDIALTETKNINNIMKT
jgi:hypothetical protein